MKTIYLVRHAKSSWSNLSIPDFERPLNERGQKDAPSMAKRLKEKKVGIDYVISSPAVRAFTTCQEFCRILGLSEKYYKTEKQLYHADADTLLQSISELNDHHQSIMLVGHNPGITQFANMLFNTTIDNIPTTGIVAGNLNITSWEESKPGCGKLTFFDYPRSRDED
jgi:phosphohistidine phosphatase